MEIQKRYTQGEQGLFVTASLFVCICNLWHVSIIFGMLAGALINCKLTLARLIQVV